MPDTRPPRHCLRVCLACHGERLASLLETASAFRFFRFEPEVVLEEGGMPMPPGGLGALAALLAGHGVALLVCGATTCCCLRHFARRGVAVAPWIAGDVPAVLAALRHDRLESLLAPGARPGPAMAGRRGFGITSLRSRR